MARSKLAIAFTLASSLLAGSAHALGLGAIEAKSTLNQPLEARIPLISVKPGELDSLKVSLASIEAFQRAGIDRPFHLSQLKFEVVKGEQPYIRVTTRQPVKEPFLDFLVEANWPRGRLVREFTLLLDPPVYAPSGRTPSVSTASVGSAAPATAQGGAAATPAAPTRAPTVVSSDASSGAAGASSASDGQYTVKANDTLSSVASRLRPDRSVTLNQMMVALLQANPNAFIDGDMNRLKRGAVLRVPERSEIEAVSPAAATAQVRQALARWRQDQSVAEAPKSATPAGQSESAAAEGGRLQVVAPTDSSGEQATSSIVDRDMVADADTIERLRRELTLSEETAASLRSENEELKAQVEALKQRLAAAERLIEIESSGVPGVGDGATVPVDEAVVAEQPVATEQPATEQPVASEQPGADETVLADTADPVAEQSVEQPVEEVAEQPVAEVEQQPAVQPKPQPAIQEPAPAPGFFDDPKNIALVGGAAVAVLALIFLLLRRRRGDDEESEAMPPIVIEDEQEPVEAEAEVEQSQPEPEPVAEAQEQGDDALLDNDPLGEVEVYLAYGRYDQALDTLTSALAQEPQRTDLRLKLMEVMALTQDVGGFEEQAHALLDQVGYDDPAWARAAEMGREFLPDSPLFGGQGGEQQAGADVDFGEFDLSDAVAAESEEPQAAAENQTEAVELDFDLEPAQPEQLEVTEQTEQADSLDTALEFSLDDEATMQPEVAESADEALDFGLEEPAPAAEQDDNVIDFSAPEEALDTLGEELDEVGTKLDLARAYLDMGDSDGARSLLDEVLEEGNSAQKREAESLLRQIA